MGGNSGRFHPSSYRPLLITLGCVLLFWLVRDAQRPGFDFADSYRYLHKAPEWLRLHSVLPFGVTPIVKALVVARLAIWTAAIFPGFLDGFARWTQRLAPAMALLFAALDANASYLGATELSILRPDPAVQVEQIACSVGALAIVMALMRLVTRQGLVNGVLALMFAEYVLELSEAAQILWGEVARRQITLRPILIAAVFFGAVVWLFVYAHRTRAPGDAPPAGVEDEITPLWPFIAADVLVRPMFSACVHITGSSCSLIGFWHVQSITWGTSDWISWSAGYAALILLFALCRIFARDAAPAKILLVAGAQMAACLVGGVIATRFASLGEIDRLDFMPLPVAVTVAVCVPLLDRLRRDGDADGSRALRPAF